MSAIRSYEFELSRKFLSVLEQVPGLRLYGPADPRRLDQRVPTFSFTLAGLSAAEAAAKLDERGIYVWDGNFYAVNVTERLGLERPGAGLIRAGAVHYNTLAEVEQLGEALQTLQPPISPTAT